MGGKTMFRRYLGLINERIKTIVANFLAKNTKLKTIFINIFKNMNKFFSQYIPVLSRGIKNMVFKVAKNKTIKTIVIYISKNKRIGLVLQLTLLIIILVYSVRNIGSILSLLGDLLSCLLSILLHLWGIFTDILDFFILLFQFLFEILKEILRVFFSLLKLIGSVVVLFWRLLFPQK